MACRFIQNSGLVSKNRARRKAVSAVTERSPFTIAPMRVAETRKAIASALIDIPRGLRNSSSSTSPGWVVTRLGVAIAFVVVDDFDIGGPFLSPDETDAPLVIDPDGVLATTVAGQRLKPVCWWCTQVVEIARGMEHVESSQRLLFYSTKTLHELAHPQTLASAIAKRFDHARQRLRRERCYVKRTTCCGLSH